MFHRIHQKLGTAGFIISIVALVAALGGGAYAASGGLNGKQKKEVEKIAKKFAGKPGVAGAQGAKGDGGAAGTNGSDGANGEKGERGPQGERGAPGEIANVVPLAKSNGEGHCELGGGVKIYNETGEGFACNGEAGSGGGGGEEGYPDTLPAGKTETGYFEFLGKSGVGIGTFVVSTLSFPLRLATAPELVYYRANAHSEEEEEKCPGTGEVPAAEPGVLCLYPQLTTPESFLSQTATPIGASFIQENTEEHPAEAGFGSWAVTAPEAP